MDKKIYQEQYDFELNQKIYLSSSINIHIVAATIIGGALSSMILNFSFGVNFNTGFFILTFFGSTAMLILTFILMFLSVIGYDYKKIALPSELNDHYKTLQTWRDENTSEDGNAKEDLDDFIQQRLGEAVEINSNNNVKRGNYLHSAIISIALATLLLSASGGFYVFNKLVNNPEPHIVKIVGNVNLK